MRGTLPKVPKEGGRSASVSIRASLRAYLVEFTGKAHPASRRSRSGGLDLV